MKLERLTLSLSEKNIELLTELAQEKGISKSALVTVAILEYNENHRGNAYAGNTK